MKTNELHTDKRGRVQRTAGQRRALIEGYKASGLGKAEFCRQHGINLATFCHWFGTKKGHKGKRASKAQTPTFAEVAVVPPIEQAAVEILLPNGSRIGIRHEGRRDDLVALVRGVAGC